MGGRSLLFLTLPPVVDSTHASLIAGTSEKDGRGEQWICTSGVRFVRRSRCAGCRCSFDLNCRLVISLKRDLSSRSDARAP